MQPWALIQLYKDRKICYLITKVTRSTPSKTLVSFIQQTPHDTKRHDLPHLNYFVVMKTSLPALWKINHKFGHHPDQTIPNNATTNNHLYVAKEQWGSR
jgi:hypothetical protein